MSLPSIPDDWTLPISLVPPAQREVECLPAEPLSARQLAPLLGTDAVVEVWVPLAQQQSVGPPVAPSTGTIRDLWVEFADRVHAVRYESPGGGCPIAWYRALRPIETGHSDDDEMVEEVTEGYTRLSERFAVD